MHGQERVVRTLLQDTEKLQVVADIVNTTWGVSSGKGTCSLKCTVPGPGRMRVVYTTIVRFASDASLRQQITGHTEDADKAIADRLKSIRREFRERTGTTLTLDRTGEAITEVETIGTSSYSPVRTAYFRRCIDLSME